MNRRVALFGAALFAAAALSAPAFAAEVLRPAAERFGTPEPAEVPDFQRHVLPLMGRLGCNGRACHGSFQGQGGFRLSLFGYDFKMDHEALLKAGSGRVDAETPEVSKILQKPTLAIPHKGGRRLEEDTWQHRLLLRWVEEGAKPAAREARFERLEVAPAEIVFEREGQKVPLRVIARWSDGVAEDVTCLTRFRSNDESIAEVDAEGVVTSKAKGDTAVVSFYDNGVGVTQVLRPVSALAGAAYPDVPTPTKIDELVVAKLRKLGVVPSPVCSDAEFLRRVSLDLSGTLPTPSEAEAFAADASPRKREKKVEEILARPSYAAWWATRLCDLTGESPRSLAGLQAEAKMARHWYEWIYARVLENAPYDKLIEGIVLATSRRPGQNYEDYVKEEAAYNRDKDPADFTKRETMPYFWARRNMRQPEEKALAFSYTFLGVRLECAQCHKHPFDQWTQDDFTQFTAFFKPVGFGTAPDARKTVVKMREDLGLSKKKGNEAQKLLLALIKEGTPTPWQEVFVNTNGAAARSRGAKKAPEKAGRVVTPKLLGGDEVALAQGSDPRTPLMDWLRDPENPYFARAVVNRVWAVYFGSGIINPPDDMNLANPPSNPALLDELAEGFIRHGFDLKWLHRTIVASQAYQRSWETNETNRYDERNFSHAAVRRLPAEVLLDAVTQVTADSTTVATFVADLEERAIGPKGNVGTGRKGADQYAQRVFGRSARETNCDCSASIEPNLLQSIFLQNDQAVLGAIARRDGWVVERTGHLAGREQRKAARARDALAVVALGKRADALASRLEAAAAGKQADRLEEQLKAVRSELEAKQRQLESAEKAEAASTSTALPFDPDQVVREAYLRTLSRRPDEHEMDAARAYMAKAGDPAKGMRDLLWALLNTKEFITNH